MEGYHLTALADCNTYSLCWLIVSSVIDPQVLTWSTPSTLLPITLLEQSLIQIDNMTFGFIDLIDLIVKSDSVLLELLSPLFKPCWYSLNTDFLLLIASSLHKLKHYYRLDPTISELSMKQNTPLVN